MCLGLSLRIKEFVAGIRLICFSRERQKRKKKILEKHEKINTGNLPFYLFDEDRMCKCKTGDCGKKRRFETETENQEFETETSALANLVGSSLFCSDAVIEL